jgi:hypothetical protein
MSEAGDVIERLIALLDDIEGDPDLDGRAVIVELARWRQ